MAEINWNVLAGLGDTYNKAADAAQARDAKQAIGDALQSGDYDSAARAAFQGGDFRTGLSLAEIAQERAGTRETAGIYSRIFGASGGGAPAPSRSAAAGTDDAPASL